MLTKTVAERVIGHALCAGGDFAELFYEDTTTANLHWLDGQLYSAQNGRLHGAGVRVIRGVLSAYAYTNDTSPQGLMQTALRAAVALGQAGNNREIILHPKDFLQSHLIKLPPDTVDMSKKIALLKAASNAAQGNSIRQVSANWIETAQRVTIANSAGLFTSDERTRVRFAVTAVAGDEHQNQTGSQSPGAQMGFEFMDSIDPGALGRAAALQAVTMLKADECPGGRVPVAIANGFGGVIIHEACVHSLEATSVAKNASEFCGKLGQTIAAPGVTVIDDGTLPNAWGSANIDDEGRPTQRNVLIENGVLQSYLVDYLGGLRMGMTPNGCGRRNGYAYAPTSRMSNTFIAPGAHTDEEIIASIADGLYAKQMGGGSVSPATGEFNFAVSEGYWIKNGRIDRPVRGATLIGRGSEVLMNIDYVGRELAFGQGNCGSQSGSVPTNVGQPMIRVRELTVGGRG